MQSAQPGRHRLPNRRPSESFVFEVEGPRFTATGSRSEDSKPQERFDLSALRNALPQHASRIAIAVLGQPNLRLCSRRELRFGSRGSLGVIVSGPKAGMWYDHENGLGGDLFDLIQRVSGGSFREVVAYTEQIIGTQPRACSPRLLYKRTVPKEETSDLGLRLFDRAKPIIGTPADRYLQWRGVLEPAIEAGEDVLRFHANCPFGGGKRYPCMLALLRNIEGNEPRAIQRTALTPELMRQITETRFTEFTQAGGRVARMTLGPKTGTAIKLSCDENVAQGLVIGEGVESVLAAMKLGFRPAWALGGTSSIKSFPVLSGIDVLTILVDNDKSGAGQKAAQQCSERWVAAGREVFRALPNHTGDDFNDVLRWRSCR